MTKAMDILILAQVQGQDNNMDSDLETEDRRECATSLFFHQTQTQGSNGYAGQMFDMTKSA